MTEIGKVSSRKRLFFIAHAQSQLGTYVAYVALLILINDRFHSSVRLSIFLLAEFIPAIFLGSFIGRYVDRTSNRRNAVLAELIRSIAYIGLAVSVPYVALLGYALLSGLGGVLYAPAVQSGLANFSHDEDQVNRIYAVQSIISSSATVIGPILGGLLLGVITPEEILLLNAATFLISAVIMYLLPLDAPTDKEKEIEQPAPSVLKGFANINSYIKGLAVSMGLVALFGGLIGVAEVYFALHVLKIGSFGLSVFIGAYGLGLITGNIISVRVKASALRYYFLGMLIVSFGLFMCAALSRPILSTILFAIAGIGNGLFSVSSKTLIMKKSDASQRGLAFGTKEAAESAGLTISLIAAGYMVSVLGPKGVLMLAGAGVLIVAMLTRLWLSFEKS